MTTDFGMEAESEVEREGTFREVDNIALWGIDEDFIGEKIKTEFFKVNFFSVAKFSGGVLKLGNPEERSREMLDFSLFIIFSKFLFIIIKAGGETALSVFVHLAGTDLELDNLFRGGNNGCMERLVAVLFRDGNIIFNTTVHRSIEGMNKAEGKITGNNIGDDNSEGG